MTRDKLVSELGSHIGKTLRLIISNRATEVLVVAVDPDGVLCRAPSAPESETGTEFWVSYDDIDSVNRI